MKGNSNPTDLKNGFLWGKESFLHRSAFRFEGLDIAHIHESVQKQEARLSNAVGELICLELKFYELAC